MSKIFIDTNLFVYTLDTKDESKQKAKNINLNETVPVSVTTVDIKSFGSKKTFAGSLEGIKQSKLVSKISEELFL